MKKIVALVLSLVMVLGLATVAFGATLSTNLNGALTDPAAALWDAKIVAEDAESAKDSEFATYTIEMTAKSNDAVIWWDGGAAGEKGETEDFEVNGEDEFVKVAGADQATIVVTEGKTITYLAPASDYNTTGWDEKAAKVTLPYVVAAKRVCDIDYATDSTATTFYKYDGTLYVATTLANSTIVFNVDGVAVPAVAATNGTEYVNVGHDYQMDSKGNTYNEADLTKVYCDDCGKTFDFVVGGPAQAVAKFGVDNYALAGQWGQDNVYVALAGTTAGDAAEGDKVESAETFDAGIAMYVGMSVMAAAGSAVVLKKKD